MSEEITQQNNGVSSWEDASEDLLWKQYEQLSGLYTFYINIVVQYNAFSYAVLGAIVTLVVTNKSEANEIAYLIFIPLLISLALSGIAFVGIPKAQELEVAIIDLKNKLNTRLAPHVDMLIVAMRVSCYIHFFVSIALGILLVILFTNGAA